MFDEQVAVTGAPASRDPVHIFRLASGIVALCAGGGLSQAIFDRRLPRRTRIIGGCGAAIGLGLGVLGARGNRASKLLVEHPTAAMLLGAAPLGWSALLAPQYNALHLLPVAGIGSTAAVLGSGRRKEVGAAAAGYWLAQAAVSTRGFRGIRSDNALAIAVLVQPLAIAASVRLAPDALTAARELALLDDKLARVRDELDTLDGYRKNLPAAFAATERALTVARSSVQSISDSGQREEAEDLVRRVAGRLDEQRAVLAVASEEMPSVNKLLDARIAASSHGVPFTVTPDYAVQEVTDSRVLALLGAVTSTALSNVVRHGVGVDQVTVELTREEGWLNLRITDDGEVTEAAPGGRGLLTHRHEAKTLTGNLEWGPAESGGWRVDLRVPATVAAGRSAGLTSEQMVALMDGALRWATGATGAMVVGMAATLQDIKGDHRKAVAAANLLVAVLYEAGEYFDWWSREARLSDPGRAQLRARSLLAVAAAVSFFSPHGKNALLSGWANSALARHGLYSSGWELGALTAAHLVAIQRSYLGLTQREALKWAPHQIATVSLGPVLMTLGVAQARKRLETREAELHNSMADVAHLHDLSETLHEVHGPLGELTRLTPALADDQVEAAVAEAEESFRRARAQLPDTFSAVAFAHQFASVLADRVWPAKVTLECDGPALKNVPDGTLSRMDFRAETLSAADRIGAHLNTMYPVDWLAQPRLRSVRLLITAVKTPASVFFDVIPEGPVAHQESIDALADGLARIGATLDDGHGDGRLRFHLTPKVIETLLSEPALD